ncbi:peptide chain release factor aRF-1 [Candidatus Woesearchaeota archaeon]|nr:peptide chain release factor aRF-1 [Candidatus Woesearchaeota archaeon]
MAELKITPEQRFRLKKLIKEIERYRGRHTELVTVYIPAGYDLNKIINHVFQEQGTATNIKSAGTRKNVISALERMIQHLKLFKQTPEHGLAAFAGNISEKEGQPNVQVWSIEPPVPLNIRVYRCDKEFVLDPLREMVEEKEIYGMVVMDRRDGIVALLKGKAIIPLVKTHSEVPGKFRAGGQSAARFAANRELSARDFYRRVGDYMKDQFLPKLTEIKGILIGGPGPTKYEFVDGDFITNDLKKKILAIKDLSYTEEFGLQELLDKCQDVLAKEEVAEEKQIVTKFLELLATSQKSVAYGYDETKRMLEAGAVATLLLSEELEEGMIEELSQIAGKFSSEVKIISTDTREGVQLRDLGKIAAILRYEANF